MTRDLLQSLRPAARNLPESKIVTVFSYGRNKQGIIPMWAGEGDLAPPAFISCAASKLLASGGTLYTYQRGVADSRTCHQHAGRLRVGIIVLVHSGRGKVSPDTQASRGTAERGAAAVAKLHFPGLHPDAARWLTTERSIHAIGLDTPSIDFGQSTLFESHQILFQPNIPAFENLAHLAPLPPTGIWVAALPMKIKGGSGGPLRVVALVPNDN